MADNVLIQAIAGIFSSAWTMMMSVRFPGSNITIANIIVGAFVITFGIRILAYVLNKRLHHYDERNEVEREVNKGRKL